MDNLTGEVWGGFAAMLVALPSSVAYGVAIFTVLGGGHIAQGAVAGMLGAIALGIVAPLVGGAPQLISAPCAPAAAVMAALAAQWLSGGPGGLAPASAPQITILMMLVAMLSGVMQIGYGALGGGRLIKYIPYPVVAGYLSGVGVLIFLSQVPKFLGLENTPLPVGLVSPSRWRWQAMVVGAVTILGMLSGPKLTKRLPGSIIGLLGGLMTYFALGLVTPDLWRLENNRFVIGQLFGSNASILSHLPGQWKSLMAVDWPSLKTVVGPALTLSVLLSIDTLKTCVVVETLTRSRSDSNRVLIGQGIGNLMSALVGGLPGSGTMGPTMVNVSSGGKTRLAPALEGAFALGGLLLFGNLVAWVPLAALAGVLIVVAFRMFDFGSFHLLKQRSTILDFGVVAAVIVVAAGYDLIAASGAGLGLAILLFMREQMRSSVIRRKVYGSQVSSKRQRLPAEQAVLQQQGRLTTICELQGSLFFGTTDRLFTELEPDLKTSRFVILDLRRVQSVDFTAAHLLERIETMLSERQAFLIFSHVPASLPTGQLLTAYFDQLGLVKDERNARIFDSFDEALEWTENRILEAAHLPQREVEAPLALAEFELVREFDSDHTLAALAACVVEKSFAAGNFVFQKGDHGDELYLVRRGTVRIQLPMEDGKHLTLATVGRGNFFGDMAFLDPGVRSADTIAIVPTDLYVISRTQFNQVVKHHPLLGVKVFARLARVLAGRLRQADDEVRALHEA